MLEDIYVYFGLNSEYLFLGCVYTGIALLFNCLMLASVQNNEDSAGNNKRASWSKLVVPCTGLSLHAIAIIFAISSKWFTPVWAVDAGKDLDDARKVVSYGFDSCISKIGEVESFNEGNISSISEAKEVCEKKRLRQYEQIRALRATFFHDRGLIKNADVKIKIKSILAVK